MQNAEKSYNEYKRRICLAMNYIVDHLEENPSLDDIAAASSFSKYHFHRIFHAVVGETVARFTKRVKLEKAANYLVYGASDITSIAHTLGFSSSQNFAKAFRIHFRMSPSEFRQQHRNHGNILRKDGNDNRTGDLYVPHYESDLTSTHERSNEMDVHVKEMPKYHVCYVRQIGAYGPENCGAANARLMQWAGPRGFLDAGVCIGIAWDNPEITPPDKCRYDACITVPPGTKGEGEVGVQTLPGGEYAFYRCKIGTDEFPQAWKRLFAEWLPGSGYQPDDRPCCEICHSRPADDPDHKWVIDICCPVRPL